MIDLKQPMAVLREAAELMRQLDGLEIDTDSIEDDRKRVGKDELRQRRVDALKRMQLLAARLDLASALVWNEYWYARGEEDPLQEFRALRKR